ncbi:MAG: X-Pro aminopeptidase [Flammeovirgaceae bacterium]|nr:X-Pro aminopeptidase [Flammeovirgaceae bacterium]
MRYHKIDTRLFVKNRQRLSEQLAPRSVVILLSNDRMPTNADGTLPFKQNSNLFYLTGVDQEDSILVFAPDHPNEKLRTQLFLKETNAYTEVWEGHKLSKEEGTSLSGIEEIQWSSNFGASLKEILIECDHVYLYQNEHLRAETKVEMANERFTQKIKKDYPLHQFKRLAPLLYDLRMIKSDVEIGLIKEACRITELGFRAILPVVKSDIWEFEVEAEYLCHFLKNRATGFAYEPIIAGGANSCILHYTMNDQKLNTGDLLLMDVGATYGNYNADMTRTIPVDGKFSSRQKQIYNAVLRVKNGAMDLLRPGCLISEYHQEVGTMMTEELLKLGLLTTKEVKNQDPKWPAYKKYFMHGTSHHLGLDVHDVWVANKKVTAGMVFTVEPGIYLSEEGFGIRLEDDILIAENGNINLMEDIPIEIDEIEDLMNQ